MRSFRAVITALSLGCIAPIAVHAQDSYPNRPIRLVVPFPAGGPADVLARIVGQELTTAWGQPVVVDNRGGAYTVIGAENASKSPADGYTLLMAIDSTLVMNQYLFSRLSYDPLKDFDAVSLAARIPAVLVVNPGVKANTVAELVALAKAAPGKLNYGAGTVSAQLAGEMFKSMTGTDITYVPYKGSAPTTQAVVGGEIQMAFDSLPTTLPHIQAGKLKALGVTSGERARQQPQLPTLAESGLPGYDVTVWLGIVAPRGTPPPVIKKLNAQIVTALQSPAVRDKLMGLGMEAAASTPEAFTAQIRTEAAKWEKPIRDAGIRLD